MEQVVAETRRHLPLPGTFNVRDVGGYPTRHGGVTRWRTLLRADSLHRLTDSSRAVLAQVGLRHVVDLRSRYEQERAPDALGRLRVEYTHAPVFPDTPAAATGGTGTLAAVYRYMVDHCGTNLATAVGALAEPTATPALVHCSAGKDRTGLVVALVLDMLGVDDELIAADFSLTSQYLRPDDPAVLGQLAEGTGTNHATDSTMLACPPDLIQQTLRYVRDRHGSVTEFLALHGADQSIADRLTTVLTTS